MSPQEDHNEQLLRELTEQVWQDRNFDVIDDLVADEFVLHDSSMPEPIRGPEGYREMAEMASGIVDGELEIDQVLAMDDWVISRWTMRGTHAGEVAGIEPTGEEVTVTGIDINRIENGKFVESWQEVNMLPMLAEIGAIPEDLFAAETPVGTGEH